MGQEHNMPMFFTQVFTECPDRELEIEAYRWTAHWKIDPEQRLSIVSPTTTTYARQLWIEADKLDDARHALAIIVHAQCLQEGSVPIYLVAQLPDQDNPLPDSSNFAGIIDDCNLQKAVKIAARLSHEDVLQYATFKHTLSKFLQPVSHMVATSRFGNLAHRETSNPIDHVIFNACVHHAYSGLEELGLEMRASKEKPSRLADGKKNPVIMDELQVRLRARNVDLDEPILWCALRQETPLSRKYRNRGITPGSGELTAARCAVG